MGTCAPAVGRAVGREESRRPAPYSKGACEPPTGPAHALDVLRRPNDEGLDNLPLEGRASAYGSDGKRSTAARVRFLTREAGEGDRRRRWRGRMPAYGARRSTPPPCFAWSPLPVMTGEELTAAPL